MKTKTVSSFAGVQHPQTEAIPQPLEIHPSVDPELARGLINAVEYINEHENEFCMNNMSFEDGKGCIICHVERLSQWRRPELIGSSLPSHPLGSWARIFWTKAWTGAGFHEGYYTTEGRIARIEHFLRSGE